MGYRAAGSEVCDCCRLASWHCLKCIPEGHCCLLVPLLQTLWYALEALPVVSLHQSHIHCLLHDSPCFSMAGRKGTVAGAGGPGEGRRTELLREEGERPSEGQGWGWF